MRVQVPARFAGVAALLLATLAPAAGMGESQPGPGHFTSGNVEWLSVNPLHTGTAGGRLHDGFFYVTDPRGVYIYDVGEPADPRLVGFVNVFQSGLGVALAQEGPDTNGEIVLVDAIDPDDPSTSPRMLVVDVSDKTDPHVVGSEAVTDHTWTCVLDCSFAFGRSGNIVDLTDPTDPTLTDVDWRDGREPAAGYTHDLTEVRPGFLMSAGQPSYYLDVRDPLNPVQLNEIVTTFHSLGFHGAEWANEGTDRFLLMGTEIAPQGPTNLAGSACDGDHGLFVYDATEVVAADEAQERQERVDARRSSRGTERAAGPKPRPDAEFHELGSWNLSAQGVYADGNAPAHVLFCEHWFDLHPTFDAGGLVVMGAYTHGTRFLEVDEGGQVEEIGWFQPVGGYTGAAYWITDEIVYVHDYARGMDILRFTGDDG